MRILALAAPLAALVMGCSGGSSSPGTDAGTDAPAISVPDTSVPSDGGPHDVGPASADAGSDSASPADAAAIDAGAPNVDASAPRDDAGLPCTASSDCGDPTTMFCEFPVGTCGGGGTCTSFGGGCPLFFRPVCGCNGHTYSNSVCAEQAGQSLRDDTGACTITPSCGCMHDSDCHAGDECVSTRTGGVCKSPIARPMCWRDADCETGHTCVGANVCECGASCIIADHAGVCS